MQRQADDLEAQRPGSEASTEQPSPWEACADDTFVARLGSVRQRISDGLIEISLQTDETHANLSGIVHGGVIMTLIDRVIGVNCRRASGGIPMVTASLTVNFLRPVAVGDRLTASCVLRKRGRTAYFADGLACVTDTLVATATGTWLRAAKRP